MSKGQNNSTVHKSYVRLIYPENVKQLLFIVSKQWNGHNLKDKGQKVKIF